MLEKQLDQKKAKKRQPFIETKVRPSQKGDHLVFSVTITQIHTIDYLKKIIATAESNKSTDVFLQQYESEYNA